MSLAKHYYALHRQGIAKPDDPKFLSDAVPERGVGSG